MSDEPFYTPNQPPTRARVAQPGEPLFEFVVGHDRYLFELRDHGEAIGVEVQIFVNEEFVAGRRFDPRLDALRPSRELAIQWAEEERKSMERGGA